MLKEKEKNVTQLGPKNRKIKRKIIQEGLKIVKEIHSSKIWIQLRLIQRTDPRLALQFHQVS